MTYLIKKIQKYPAFWLISQFKLSYKNYVYCYAWYERVIWGVKLCWEYKTVLKSAYLTHSHTKWNSFSTTLISQHLHSLFSTGIFLNLPTSIPSVIMPNRNWANSDRLCLEILFLRDFSVCKPLLNFTHVLNFGLDNQFSISHSFSGSNGCVLHWYLILQIHLIYL